LRSGIGKLGEAEWSEYEWSGAGVDGEEWEALSNRVGREIARGFSTQLCKEGLLT
jgi:hypothetical protein